MQRHTQRKRTFTTWTTPLRWPYWPHTDLSIVWDILEWIQSICTDLPHGYRERVYVTVTCKHFRVVGLICARLEKNFRCSPANRTRHRTHFRSTFTPNNKILDNSAHRTWPILIYLGIFWHRLSLSKLFNYLGLLHILSSVLTITAKLCTFLSQFLYDSGESIITNLQNQNHICNI